MIWFGSSAGLAISNVHPEAKSVGKWLLHGMFNSHCLCYRILRDPDRMGLASHYRLALLDITSASKRLCEARLAWDEY